MWRLLLEVLVAVVENWPKIKQVVQKIIKK